MKLDSSIIALATAILGAIVSIISLIVSSQNQLNIERVKSNLLTKQKIEEEDRLLNYKRLSEFYDPILILLEVNGDIFQRLGPGSSIRSDASIPQEEIANIWERLINDVVLPGNEEITKIIKAKLHLLSPDDSIRFYIKFVTHAYVYRIFREQPSLAYTFFQFPKGFERHIRLQRENLYAKLEVTKVVE